MPPNRHSFDESPLPSRLIVDSSFLFEAVVDSGQGRHEVALEFVQRLRAADSMLVYSSLMFLEAPQCWRRSYARGALVPRTRGVDLTTDRVNAFIDADNALNELLGSFLRRRVGISRRLMDAASLLVAEFNLSSHDALLIAVARETRVPHVVTFDRDFRRVDGIELWDGLLAR